MTPRTPEQRRDFTRLLQEEEAAAADRPTTEPRTEAGRETLEAYGPNVATEYGDDTPLRLAILAIEAEAAQGGAPPDEAYHKGWTAGYYKGQRDARSEGAAPRAEGLDVPTLDDLLDEHELAAALHAEFWTDDKPHIVDPPEGDDCAICYDTADRIITRLSRPSDERQEEER